MNINASKTTYTIFTLSPKLLRLKLKIRDKWLEREDNPRYLGITFDPRLTWKKHLEETQTKGVRRTALLKKLAGTTWGANQAVLKKTYVGYTRPAIEYGIAVWGTTAKSNFKEMARIQNQNLRIINWWHEEHSCQRDGSSYRTTVFRRQARQEDAVTACQVQISEQPPYVQNDKNQSRVKA